MDPQNPQTPRTSSDQNSPDIRPLAPQPEVYNSPTLTPPSYAMQSNPQQNQNAPTSTFTGPDVPAKKSRKGPMIAIIAGGLVALTLIAVAVIASNSNSPKSKQVTPDTSQVSGQTDLLKPAQAIDIEQTNNGLNQDLSGLDEEKDFPANALDDKSLSL